MLCSIWLPIMHLQHSNAAVQHVSKPLWNAVDYDFMNAYAEKLSAYAIGRLTVFQQGRDARASLRDWFSFRGGSRNAIRDRPTIRPR